MSDLSDDEADHLLSRGGLGREHKERLLLGILASVPASPAPPPRSRRRWTVVGALSLASAVALVGLWWRPSAQQGSELRAKGASAAVPFIGMSCLGGSVSACPRGSRVAFWLEGGTDQIGFITAYADPVDGGERVWLLTNEPLASSPSTAVESPRVIPKAAVLGAAQSGGRYVVQAVLSRSRVARAGLSDLPSIQIVTRARFELVVSP
jgi:hypothetical protein